MLQKGFVCTLCLALAACAPTGPSDEGTTGAFPELRGPYLGQKMPGLEPEVFAPGIVSTGLATRDVAMTPDGEELYFSVTVGGRTMIMVSRSEDGVWSEPEVASFSGRYLDIEPSISADGQKFFMTSRAGGDTGLSLTARSISDLLEISTRPGQGSSDIWWVSAEIIEGLRP